MNKGIGAIIIGIIAVIGGAALAALFIKNKLDKKKEEELDFDDLDNPVDDEEFEKFFGDDDDNDASDAEEASEAEAEEAADELEETDSDAEEQL